MLIPFKELFRRHRIKASGCLHLGASSGQERTAYAALGIPVVIWVEALPEVHAQLVKNVSPYRLNRALLGCLGENDGDAVTFNVANNEGQSSSYLQFGSHAVEHPDTKFTSTIQMTTVRVDTLLAQHGIHMRGQDWFLNVDLQGAELKALRGMGVLMQHFRYAYIEINIRELYQGCPLAKDIDAFMAGHGFRPVETKLMKQGWGDRVYIRK